MSWKGIGFGYISFGVGDIEMLGGSYFLLYFFIFDFNLSKRVELFEVVIF